MNNAAPDKQAFTKSILGEMIPMEDDDKIVSFAGALCLNDEPERLCVALGAPEQRRSYWVQKADILEGSKCTGRHKRGVIHIHSRATLERGKTGTKIGLTSLLDANKAVQGIEAKS